MSDAKKPRFVNLQGSSVKIYDENRRPLLVLPYSMRRSAEDVKGFVVEGEFYRQFVSGAGPLYPFPVSDEPLRTVPMSDADLHAAAIASAARVDLETNVDPAGPRSKLGKLRLSGDVVRAGTVIGETQEAFIEKLRPKLMDAGLKNADAVLSASDEALLDVRFVTFDNVKRVRELASLIFPASTSGTAPIAEPPPDVAIAAENPALVDEDGDPLNTYKLSDLLAMDRQKLRGVIDSEGFVISKAGSTVDVRERLLSALRDYNMLIE